MTLSQEAQDAERLFVEGLRSRYEAAGYAFQAYPARDRLPAFMGGYSPDAIASKGDRKIAIEVKNRRGSAADLSVARIRRIFDGHRDWQFRVMLVAGDPLDAIAIPSGTPESVGDRLVEVRELVARGYNRAAFLVAWSLLEAVARMVDPDAGQRPYSPGTIVQALAMTGHIEPAVERRVRHLIDLRNRVVHGDLEADPSASDVEVLASAIEAVTLDAAPSP